EPSPNIAFVIRQKNKKDRVVEQMNFKDLIVSRYLVKTVYKLFDTIFEEASIGSRKGISRERAVELIKTALAEGYEYMIESDIEEFFPSVDLQVLHRLLDSILPTGDTMLKQLLEKLTGNGYLLEGRFHERLKGLALGNPLSPCLANLYLDSFDEYIKELDVKLIRCEDDFIIQCKSRDDAETIALKLNIDPEQKVFGSTFFQKGGNLFKKESHCIDEVGVFLGLMGNMIFVKKGQGIINVMPLRKIEDIEIRGDSIVSAALLRRCKEWDIPLVIRLMNGYVLPVLGKSNMQ
ncbi:MAG TPA: reverse transcriptase domain-containing protein, partial [Candidatus Kapabacteria bacterium]|nr:reverse transcriptase domain-containing protein [Candidatus Kapabacteria bacterium]